MAYLDSEKGFFHDAAFAGVWTSRGDKLREIDLDRNQVIAFVLHGPRQERETIPSFFSHQNIAIRLRTDISKRREVKTIHYFHFLHNCSIFLTSCVYFSRNLKIWPVTPSFVANHIENKVCSSVVGRTEILLKFFSSQEPPKPLN